MATVLSNSEKAKVTLLSFFDNIHSVLLCLEAKEPSKFKTGVLSFKPSTKLNILKKMASNKEADSIAELYISNVIDGYVKTDDNKVIKVRELLLNRDESFILKHIFKILNLPKASDIEPFLTMWNGIDKDGNISSVKLSDKDKAIGWDYFIQMDKYICLYYHETKGR